MIEYIESDIVTMIRNNLSGKVEKELLIAHGCNCTITQKSGIAGNLRVFPEIYEADLDYGRKNDPTKLGNWSTAVLNELTIVLNLYTQFGYGVNKRHFSYDAFAEAIEKLKTIVGLRKLHIPRIGAGLAGGNWEVIESIMQAYAPDMKIVVIDYTPGVDYRLIE